MELVSEDNKKRIDEVCPPSDKPSDIGAALENVIHHVGDMGTYQRLLFVAMMPFGVFWSFVYFGQMFLTATPQEHWCYVPELAALPLDASRNLSIPGAVSGEYDHCIMYDANWTEVLEVMQPPHPDTPTVPCRNGWVFLHYDIPYSTVVSEREWVCDRAYLEPLSQAINFLGSIFGGILFGTLADMFGRVPMLVLANLCACVGGVATTFTSGFWDFTICRFLVGMSCDSLFLMMYILVLEYVGTTHRTWVANLSIAFYFGTGCLLLPWIALWVSNWRHLSLVLSLPMLFVLLTPFFVPESTRWLVSKGNINKAVKILRRFEKINGRKIPRDVFDDFALIARTSKPEKEESALMLFKTPSLRIILIFLIIAFMAVAVVFDGLIRLSETLGLDFFLTFTVTSATEIPSIAILVLLLDRYGRRKLVCVPIMLAGLISFIAAFVPRGIASVSLAVLARFFTNMSYGAVIQWTPELLPTAVRASGASFVHISAFAAVAFSPFIVFSERAWESLPLILVAVVGLLGGAMALLLPETAGRPMPQTMEDWEQLASTRPYQRKRKPAQMGSSTPAAVVQGHT
ncbi:solute carrier family 22 member 3-like [Pectinophora gossypiella]|uniref:solute carrier family 22 member 3-like n=1 Tax=Pectinophora gossypiella TaxID=13191 RepID=UPI00214E1134|nr:solute carrier family 22 member 3-like [Pectinophora gossypiella]